MKLQIVKKLITAGVILAHMSGCATYTAYYDIALQEVERPAQAKTEYGDNKILKIQDVNIGAYNYEDDMVRIIWIFTPSRISFSLQNKTAHTIKIIWDEAAFLDENSLNHRVIHSGIKYNDRYKPQPPTIIMRNSSINDVIIPASYVYAVQGSGETRWAEKPIFPCYGQEASLLQEAAEKSINKNIQILLPLEANSFLHEYIFTFKVANVTVRELKPY